MKKKKNQEQWAVLRKGCYHPVFVTYSKKEAEDFVKGHEHLLSVEKVIE